MQTILKFQKKKKPLGIGQMEKFSVVAAHWMAKAQCENTSNLRLIATKFYPCFQCEPCWQEPSPVITRGGQYKGEPRRMLKYRHLEASIGHSRDV
jgi:hypothetical protein